MSLEHRIASLEAQANGPGPRHTPALVFYQPGEDVVAVIQQAICYKPRHYFLALGHIW